RSEPAPGMLVVHLPDDAPPPEQEEEGEDASQIVSEYRPFLVSEGMVPFFSLWRGTSLAFQTRPLPPTWLTARIVRTKPTVRELRPPGLPEGARVGAGPGGSRTDAGRQQGNTIRP
ncbi:MAG: hypothetical protein LJF30_17675, partial [Acidobacteria bacterium]|nr:hypothetical protein [Acidobacteriota bacterium]